MDVNEVIHPGFIAILFFATALRWAYLAWFHPPIVEYIPKWQLNMPALIIRLYVFLIYSWFAWTDVPVEIRAIFARLAFFAWGAEELVAFIVMLSFDAAYRNNHKT